MARILRWPRVGVLVAPLLAASAISIPALAGTSPAGASASSLEAEASQLNEQLIEEELQVNAFEQQYETDATRVAQDNVAVAAVEQQVTRDRARVHADRVRLTQEAVSTYVNAGSIELNQTLQLFAGIGEADLNRSEYESVAIGNTAQTIAVLHIDQVQLAAGQATLELRAAQDRTAESAAAAATGNARQIAAELASKEALVTGQLAVDIASDREQIAVNAAAARSSVGGAVTDPSLPPFLQCVLQHESGGNYQAVDPSGTYFGGFQFSQSTWNEAAQLAGLPELIGVQPNEASAADQDTLAVALYEADGEQPWLDGCG